jgi:hypothetical protein
MHTKPMAEFEGNFTKGRPVPDVQCRRCGEKGKCKEQLWESSCGGYEDYKYTCGGCGHVWWVEGIDS